MNGMPRSFLLAFLLPVLSPIVISAAEYLTRDRSIPWREADRSSVGLLPGPQRGQAHVRVFAARRVSWRGIVASHCWIVIKAANDAAYRRFDYTAWNDPIWVDRFVADGRWFSRRPKVVFVADGEQAGAMISLIMQAIRDYRYLLPGDYRAWPGPNSNAFVAAVMSAVPGIGVNLPLTAVGKDFPYDGRRNGVTPSAPACGSAFLAISV